MRNVELQLESGGSIWVEVDGADDMPERTELAEGVRSRGITDRVSGSFESTLDSVRGIANSLQSSLTDLVEKPDSVSVEFGVKFTATSGVIIASGSGEANLKICMEWKSSNDDNK